MIEGSSPARPSPTVLKMWAESQPSPGLSEHAAPLYIDYDSLRRRMQLAGYGITVTPSVSELSQLSGPADNYSIYSTPAPSVLSSPPASPTASPTAHSPPGSPQDFLISPVVPSHAVNISATSTVSRASAGSRHRQQSPYGTRPSPKPRVLDFDTLAVPSGQTAHQGDPASIWPFNQTPLRPSDSQPVPQAGAAEESVASGSSLGSTDIFTSLQKVAGGPLWDKGLQSHKPMSSLQSSVQEFSVDLSRVSEAPPAPRVNAEASVAASVSSMGSTDIFVSLQKIAGGPLWDKGLQSHKPMSSHQPSVRESFGDLSLSQMSQTLTAEQNHDQDSCYSTNLSQAATSANEPLWGETLKSRPPASSAHSSATESYTDSVLLSRTRRSFDSWDASELRRTCGVVPEGEEANLLDVGAPLWGTTLAGHPPLSSIQSTECDAYSAFGDSQDASGFPVLLSPAQEPAPDAKGPEDGPFKNYFLSVQQQQREGLQQSVSPAAGNDLVSSLQSWTAVSPHSGDAAIPRALQEDDHPAPMAEADAPPPKGSQLDHVAVQSVEVAAAGDRPRGPEYWKGRAEFWASRTEAADPPSAPIHASLPASPAASSAQGSPVGSTSDDYRLPALPKEDLRQQAILISAARASTRDISEDSGPPNEAGLADSSAVVSETMSTTALQSQDVSLEISSFEDDSKAAMETSSNTPRPSLSPEHPLVSLSPEKSDSPRHITPRGQSYDNITPRGQSDPLVHTGILSPDDVEDLSKAVKEIQGELTAKPQSQAEREALVAKYSQLQAEFMALQEKAINDPVLRSSVTTPRQIFEVPPSAAAASRSPDMMDALNQKAAVAHKKVTSSPQRAPSSPQRVPSSPLKVTSPPPSVKKEAVSQQRAPSSPLKVPSTSPSPPVVKKAASAPVRATVHGGPPKPTGCFAWFLFNRK